MANTITSTSPNEQLSNLSSEIITNQISAATQQLNIISKEKYDNKNKLIENATDMTTKEKLEAMDQNYAKHFREVYSSIFAFALLSLSIAGIAVGSPTVIKSVKKIIA